MHFASIFNVLGVLVMMFSITLLPPVMVSVWYSDGAFMVFVATFFIVLLCGFFLWLLAQGKKHELRTRDGFAIVSLFWTSLSVLSSIPFMLAETPHLPLVDAIFETVSGLTTTGTTVIVGLDTLPPSILYYRQQLQGIAGIGIIVFALAVLPILRVGGMQLYRAETPGPTKDKLTPRITDTAKTLSTIYIALIMLCALAYWAAGMSLFDAIGHSYATIALGGFSTHDQSIGYFNSPLISGLCAFFMFISGVNFSLHFLAWRYKNIILYFRDPEFLLYTGIIFITIAIVCFVLVATNTYDAAKALEHGTLMVVASGATAGFFTADISHWPGFLPILIFLVSFSGGCIGSTGGGLKVFRVLLILKQSHREIKRLLHPNGVFLLKVGNKPVSDQIMNAVWAFTTIYAVVFLAALMGLMATGMDLLSAFSAVTSCINNQGLGLGAVAAHYRDIGEPAKWILSLTMLLGRLEIFTLLVLFLPMFWRR